MQGPHLGDPRAGSAAARDRDGSSGDLWEYLSRTGSASRTDGESGTESDPPRARRATTPARRATTPARRAIRPARRARKPTRAAVLFFLTLALVGVGGVALFRAIRSPEPAVWPDRVAVIGFDESVAGRPLSYLAIVDPVRQTVVEVPTHAVVEVPGSGFLRVFHAWRLGGAPLTRQTLGRLFAVEVPFSVSGPGDSLSMLALNFTQAEILADRLDELREALNQAGVGVWTTLQVTGAEAEGGTLVLEPRSVQESARAIGGYGTRVFPGVAAGSAPVETEAAEQEPGPGPEEDVATIPPASLTVEVLNGGDIDGAATKTSQRLRSKGYGIGRIGDLNDHSSGASVVYYTTAGKQDAARQVAEDLGGYPVERLPERIRTTADVLVVVGDDAQL